MEAEDELSGRTRGKHAGQRHWRNGELEKNPILHFIKPVKKCERASGMSGHGFQTIPFNKVGRKHPAEF